VLSRLYDSKIKYEIDGKRKKERLLSDDHLANKSPALTTIVPGIGMACSHSPDGVLTSNPPAPS
jgi:hypothetical protein